MRLLVQGIPTEAARRLQAGGLDAHGQLPLRRRATGTGNPCRHCLQPVAEGDEMLVLAYRPFDTLQPYAEVGPVFLHAAGCTRHVDEQLPAWMTHMTPALVRGYGADDWIRYDTAAVVSGPELHAACVGILSDPSVAYVHLRSKFNCFQCRVERADEAGSPTVPI